jgi:DMSO/TMAO reductase YedYZ molybdopterin-dependent catalytic subunit
MAHSDPPADADPADWTVTLTGAVADDRTLTVPDLARGRALDSSTACEGETAPDQRWVGTTVGAVLDGADPRPTASHALVRSADPDYACGFALDRLRDAVLAVRVDGDPIPTGRGGPVRLLVPDADCWERVKWVTQVEVLESPPGDADTAREYVLGDD